MQENKNKIKIAFNWGNIGIVVVSVLVIILVIGSLPYLVNKTKSIFPRFKKEEVTVNTENLETELNKATPSANMQNDLKTEDIKLGSGTVAKDGDEVTVHYTGTLTNGKKFDSSLDRSEPFKFKLGAGEVIKGWDLGIVGMKVGGKRKLTIPSDLGYGERGAGASIPPNSTLLFEVELLEVK